MKGIVVVFLLAAAGPTFAHDLRHEVGEARGAVSVRLVFSDGEAFSFASYEVYRTGEKEPFQVGRTDAAGSLVFLPDRAGKWRVRAFSPEGHGIDFSFTTGAGGVVEREEKPMVDRYRRVITGVALVFGFFGLINLVVARRERRKRSG